MAGIERRRAFKAAAARQGVSAAAAALLHCGVTWDHLSKGLVDPHRAPLSPAVRHRFAEYIGVPVEEVFGETPSHVAA